MRLLHFFVLLPSLASAGEFHRLQSEQATATSFLQNNWNKYQENYHPNYALDDDPKTAWVEGAEGDGVGEALTLPLSALKTARAVRLVIFNGYQKSAALLTANAAPQTLDVIVHGPGGAESAHQQLTLERKLGPQSFDLPVKAGVADVVLKIESVHPGSKYRDTCISDVQVFVDSDETYKAGVEQGKHEALLRWKKERLTTAKYYASLPKTYPYASAHFERKDSHQQLLPRYNKSPDSQNNPGLTRNPAYSPLETLRKKDTPVGKLSAEDWALLQEVAKLSEAPPKQGHWYTLTAREGAPVPPEGFTIARSLEPLFHLGEETLFEAPGPGQATPAKPPDQRRDAEFFASEARSNLLVLEGSAQDVKKVYFTYKFFSVDRTTTTTTTHVLAQLEGGRLLRMVTFARSQTAEFELQGESQLSLGAFVPTYTEGKVSRVESHELNEETFTPPAGRDSEGPTAEAEQGIYEDTLVLTAQTRS